MFVGHVWQIQLHLRNAHCKTIRGWTLINWPNLRLLKRVVIVMIVLLWRGSGTCLLTAFTHVQYALFCVINCQICDACFICTCTSKPNPSFRNEVKKEAIFVALDIIKKGKTKCSHQIFHLWTSIVSDFFPLRRQNCIFFGEILKDGKKLHTITVSGQTYSWRWRKWTL